MGLGGGVGTTVTALAIAETLGAARLVELCQPWASGLAEATTSELGEQDGWRLGTRDGLLIERREQPTATIRNSPGIAIVDVGSWTGDAPPVPASAALVVVARCSVPSLRRLSILLETLPESPTVVVVVGAPVRAWPKAVAASLSPLLRSAIADDLIHTVPECSDLARSGVTTAVLPKSLLGAVARFVDDLEVDPSC
ncbi:hypothetical protein FOJ82_00440 [Tessaracoccus rhinocerotis]|uniref:Uncharacterized protein n=1 Tax=Tessaracoccus rhinocerotis TaxID=1689449 RepID=A0A553K3Y5_9ACTN|nr:hypothetical protein [Tessaracoccus rhinocerotis]TRY19420.1 hypothetical protein FOJ82_00440 [Tessaracoccus rhinocerotis]